MQSWRLLSCRLQVKTPRESVACGGDAVARCGFVLLARFVVRHAFPQRIRADRAVWEGGRLAPSLFWAAADGADLGDFQARSRKAENVGSRRVDDCPLLL
jgi:hypothetical protein